MSSSTDPITSHGRGGAGNIAPDEKAYADGDIVREGPLGDQGDGAYSSGRGGAGNINSPHLKPAAGKVPGDRDVIPEAATGPKYEEYHVGRGGEGNVHKDKEHKGQEGMVGRVKDALGGHHTKKEGE